jgi:hypothetical protein
VEKFTFETGKFKSGGKSQNSLGVHSLVDRYRYEKFRIGKIQF